MDLKHIERLKEEQRKGLQLCLQKIEQWEKFKADYEALILRLETLPNKISHDIMVPFGSLAFMPGHIIHTNEILVLLGDNWFADMSSKQAAEVAERRKKQCDKMLLDLQKEKEQFESWLSYTAEITDEDLVEIIEEYDPEKEKLWQEQHVIQVKDYHGKISEENKSILDQKQKNPESVWVNDGTLKTDEELWLRLDNLKVEEDEKNEMAVSSENNSESSDDDDDDDSESSEDDNSESDTVEDSDNTMEEREGQRVRWKDQLKSTTNQITFSHNVNNSQETVKCKDLEEEKCASSSTVIQNPSDIYKCFGKTAAQKPKSILKTSKSSKQCELKKLLFDSDESIPIVNVKEVYPLPKCQNTGREKFFTRNLPKFQPAFTGEVQEHAAADDKLHQENLEMPSKSVSKFKSSRQKIQR